MQVKGRCRYPCHYCAYQIYIRLSRDAHICMYVHTNNTIHYTCIHAYILRTYIFMRRVVPHRTAASLAASPGPTPPTQPFPTPQKNQRHALAHARGHVRRLQPRGWGAAGMGGVCLASTFFFWYFFCPPAPYNSLRRPRVTNTSRLVVNGALKVASGEMESNNVVPVREGV